MFNEAESREKWLRRREDADASIAPSVCVAAGTATNPGINDQTAALTPFGSTGTMQMTILSKKYTDALFREPSKISCLGNRADSRTYLSFIAKMAQNGRKTPLTDDITLQIFL